jgi:hypothetical protein
MTSLRIKPRLARVRDYAARLARTTNHNPMAPSRLALDVEAEYRHVSDDVLIASAREVLRAARLTGLMVRTKADAIAVIEGIRPAVGRAR